MALSDQQEQEESEAEAKAKSDEAKEQTTIVGLRCVLSVV